MSTLSPRDATNGHNKPPAAPPAPHSTIHKPELDVAKLQSLPTEQQDLFLLQFVADLSIHVQGLSEDDCTAQQYYLKIEVFKVISLQAPRPSKVVRNNLGKILATVFTKGDRKLLFETINDLVGIISGQKSKTEVDARSKHAAVSCLGDVYAAAGDSVIGLHPLCCSSIIKLMKSSPSNAGLRSAVFASLAKIVQMVGTSMDENVARDIWKQSRNFTTSDKGSLVVVMACRCLQSLAQHTLFFSNVGDFESLKSTLLKLVDSPSPRIRHAVADCLAEAMAQTHAETISGGDTAAPAPKIKKPKVKPLKRASTAPLAQDEDDVPPRSRSPAPVKKSSELYLSVPEMLRVLSAQYVKVSTTNRARATLGVCYGKLLRKLGELVVESNYLQIVENLTVDLLAQPTIANNRYRLLISRRIVDTILNDVVGSKILSESGQAAAAKILISNVLKNYPQSIPERPELNKHMLIASLGALAAMVSALGSAANNFADACRDGLLQVLQHPSYAVQVFASSCMKKFVLACPQQLLPCLSVCMNSLSRELSQLGTGRNSSRRCAGFAHGLAATLSVSPARPLHGSVDVNSRVLTMATNLLKSSGQSELRLSATQIQVAWILIGGLMSLGPNFVKIHLSQLLLLWKNALPKPLAKDNTSSRSYLETSFLAHVRECALGSILAFLQFNARLLTVDVSKRITAMLQNTTAFLRTLPSKKTTDDQSQILTPALQLYDLEMMVQRRVLQCYVKLVNISPAGGSESLLQSNLLTLTIPSFCDPETYSLPSLGTSIANSAATFESIWVVGDNSGFGLTGMVSGFDIRKLPGQYDNSADKHLVEVAGFEDKIDKLLLSPICGSIEHDASILYIGKPGSEEGEEGPPDPPATEVTNMAIQLFAFVFPLNPAKVQESILEQIKTFATASSLQRDAGRRAAITVNLAMAVLSILRVAVKETPSPEGDVTSSPVEHLLHDMIRDFTIDTDPFVRNLGYSALALLCNVSGSAFTAQEIKYLVDTIVINREPGARAGCAMALGAIQAKVGGMSAGYHLKTILGILMSLCNDPHPTVHYWSLEALSLASDAAGLSFSSYVPSTLAMLAQLYMSEAHNPEVASTANMNLEMELTTVAAITRCIDSLINVLGPDLQDSAKPRELILTMVGQLQCDESLVVQKASLICYEHLSLYAPGHINFVDYVKMLQKYLVSDHSMLRDIAVDGLHNMMKRDPRDVLEAAEKGLEDQFWLVLDSEPTHDGIRNTLRNWVRKTCLTETTRWLQRFQAVFRMARRKQAEEAKTATAKAARAHIDLQDEEAAGFATAAAGIADNGKEVTAASDSEPLRWQVTTFAVDCLNDIFLLVTKDVVTNGESAAHTALQGKIGDVVRLAFSASTSSVLELRIWGLKIIDAVLKTFGRTPDPDFEEAMLLEQYQAQISSALTPAFAADSSPELAAEAIRVCADFIATGIVTDVDRMGRILKTLINALESFSKEQDNASIGDLKGLSSNAQVMVKMSVFSAWAELQVASSEQKYLLEVLRPHIATLTPLWLDSLREFARLRFEPDISMTLGPPSLSGSLDTIYAALNRETLLKFYQDSWLKLVDAIASLIEQDSKFVFDALDGKESGPEVSGVDGRPKGSEINYRDEPVAFFFVLFGLAFEALATKPGQSDSLTSREQTLAILQALKKILHPSVSGLAIYREAVFSETMDLLDRLVLTDGLDVQGVIVDIARALCESHPSARKQQDSDDTNLTEDIEQLFELTRIIVLVLSGLLPGLGDGSSGSQQNAPLRHQMTEEATLLVHNALDALVDAAEVFPVIIKTDLHACIIHIFAVILSTPSCQEVVAPQSLPTLKRFLASMTRTKRAAAIGDEETSSTAVQLQGCLRRFLSIYLNGQKRETSTSLACVKNCLLASTVLFTGGQNHLPASDPLVTRYLEELLDCLTDRMTAKIAAGCIRSLLTQQHEASAENLTMARYLVPRLVSFIINTEPEDPEKARYLIAHALAQFVLVLPQDRVPAAMGLVVPALMARAASEDENVYQETSSRLLALAAANQAAFRAVVAGMSEGQKAFLEEVIRSGRQTDDDKGHETETASGQPTIALKMDFGS